jgi:hypothetical protein
MVTTKTEGIHLMQIVLRYLDKEVALKMLNDMSFEVGAMSDNESLKSSIEMVRGFLE